MATAVRTPSLAALAPQVGLNQPPSGAVQSAAMGQALGDLATQMANSAAQKQQLMGMADAMEGMNPQVADMMRAQAAAIPLFGAGGGGSGGGGSGGGGVSGMGRDMMQFALQSAAQAQRTSDRAMLENLSHGNTVSRMNLGASISAQGRKDVQTREFNVAGEKARLEQEGINLRFKREKSLRELSAELAAPEIEARNAETVAQMEAIAANRAATNARRAESMNTHMRSMVENPNVMAVATEKGVQMLRGEDIGLAPGGPQGASNELFPGTGKRPLNIPVPEEAGASNPRPWWEAIFGPVEEEKPPAFMDSAAPDLGGLQGVYNKDFATGLYQINNLELPIWKDKKGRTTPTYTWPQLHEHYMNASAAERSRMEDMVALDFSKRPGLTDFFPQPMSPEEKQRRLLPMDKDPGTGTQLLPRGMRTEKSAFEVALEKINLREKEKADYRRLWAQKFLTENPYDTTLYGGPVATALGVPSAESILKGVDATAEKLKKNAERASDE